MMPYAGNEGTNFFNTMYYCIKKVKGAKAQMLLKIDQLVIIGTYHYASTYFSSSVEADFPKKSVCVFLLKES